MHHCSRSGNMAYCCHAQTRICHAIRTNAPLPCKLLLAFRSKLVTSNLGFLQSCHECWVWLVTVTCYYAMHVWPCKPAGSKVSSIDGGNADTAAVTQYISFDCTICTCADLLVISKYAVTQTILQVHHAGPCTACAWGTACFLAAGM